MDSTRLVDHSRSVAARQRVRERDQEWAGAGFPAVVDALPDALLVVDSTGRIALANHAADDLFGFAPGSLAGRPVEGVLPPGLPASAKLGAVAVFDTWARRADGREFPAEVALGPLGTGAGATARVARVRDLTDRQEIEARYRAVSELTSDVAVAFHIEADGTTVVDWVTGGHERLTGYTVEETEALGWRNLVHPLDRPEYEARVGALQEGETDDSEVRILRKDGDVRYTRIQMRRVPSEPDTLRFFGAVQDLTEQRRVERQVHDSEERYRTVSELTSDVAYAYHLDTDGRVVVDWVTDGIERLTGYPAEEAIGAHGWRDLIVPEERPAYEAELDRLVAGEAVTEEFRIRTKAGEVRWVEIFARSETTADGVFRVFGAARDVTDHKQAELDLAESAASLREAQEVAGLGSWSYDERAGSLVWSDEMFRIHGMGPDGEPLTIEQYMEVVHPDDRPTVTAASRRVVRESRPYDFEYRVARRDGTVRWLHARGRPVVDGGAVVGMRGIVLDVTTRKQTELALAESERRLREAQRVAALGHFRRDLRDDTLQWSDEVYRIFGFEPGSVEVTFDWLAARVHPDDLGSFRKVVAEAIERGRPLDYEYRIRRADGEVRWLHTRAEPERDAEGTQVALVGVTQDVTERRRGEDLHRVVSEMVSDIVFSYLVVDGRMVLEWVTPAFERVTGHAVPRPLPEELFRPITHPADVHLIEEAEASVLVGDFQVAEIRVLTPDGQVRWLRLYAQPVRDDASGDVVRVYGAAQDVTARKEAEEALRRAYEQERNAAAGLREADRMKDEFLSTASHELRTPLTAIVGFASALSRAKNMDDATRAQITEKLERNALALGTMVERLLDFSRLEAGAVRIDLRPIDPAEVLARTVEMLAADLDRHPLEIDVPPGLEVRADAAGLIHVLSNLLGNAAKYSPDGTPIRVRVAVQSGSAEFTVEDDGPGMPPDVVGRAFDRFFRGPEQPAGQRGTGIGLSIARSYVELLGGRIWVESEPGTGTRFHFTLPLPDSNLASL